jgi:hypothetical protein
MDSGVNESLTPIDDPQIWYVDQLKASHALVRGVTRGCAGRDDVEHGKRTLPLRQLAGRVTHKLRTQKIARTELRYDLASIRRTPLHAAMRPDFMQP